MADFVPPPGVNPLGDPLAYKHDAEIPSGSHKVTKVKPNTALGKLATAVKVVAQVIFGVALSPVILPALLASKRNYTHEGLGGKADRVATKVRQFFAKVFSGPLAQRLFGASSKALPLKAKYHDFISKHQLDEPAKKALSNLMNAVLDKKKSAIVDALFELPSGVRSELVKDQKTLGDLTEGQIQGIARAFERANTSVQKIKDANLPDKDKKLLLDVIEGKKIEDLTANSTSLIQAKDKLFISICSQQLSQETVNFLNEHWNDYKDLFGKRDKRYVEHVLNHPENKIYQVQALLRLLNQEKQGDRVLLEKVYSIISHATIEEIEAILQGLPKKQTFTPIFHAREFKKENEPKEIAITESIPVTSSQSAEMSQRANLMPKLKLLCELKLKLVRFDAPEFQEVKAAIFHGIKNQLVHGKKHPQLERLIAENISMIRDERIKQDLSRLYAIASEQVMAMKHPIKEGYESRFETDLASIKRLQQQALQEGANKEDIVNELIAVVGLFQGTMLIPYSKEEIIALLGGPNRPFQQEDLDYILRMTF